MATTGLAERTKTVSEGLGLRVVQTSMVWITFLVWGGLLARPVHGLGPILAPCLALTLASGGRKQWAHGVALGMILGAALTHQWSLLAPGIILFWMVGRSWKEPLVWALAAGSFPVLDWLVRWFIPAMPLYHPFLLLGEAGVLISLTYLIRPGVKTQPTANNGMMMASFFLLAGLALLSLPVGIHPALSPAAWALHLFVMVIAFSLGDGYGASIGAAAALLSRLLAPDFWGMMGPECIAVLSLGGMVLGLTRNRGRSVAAFSFTLVSLIYLVTDVGYPGLVPVAGAALIFMALPNQAFRGLSRIFPLAQNGYEGRFWRRAAAARLQRMGQTLDELGRIFQQGVRQVSYGEREELMALVHTVTGQVCTNCSRKRSCWEQNPYGTYAEFIQALSEVDFEKDQGVQIPPNLKNRCVQLPTLAGALEGAVQVFRAESRWQQRLHECKSVVSGQLKGLSMMLNTLAGQVASESEGEDMRIQRLEKMAAENGLRPREVLANPEGTITFFFDGCENPSLCPLADESRLIAVFGKAWGQEMELCYRHCSQIRGEGPCEMVLGPKERYSVDIGVARISRKGSLICGDNYSHVKVNSKVAVLLSDGMGAGPKAALQSQTTISLLADLLQCGLDKQYALRLVNQVLLLRSPGESFSTLDLAFFDLLKGHVHMMKTGSHPSYLLRRGRVEVFKGGSLPIGILNQVDVIENQALLEVGDRLVLVSDGVAESGEDQWLPEFLRHQQTAGPQELAEAIIAQARHLAGGEATDDMTVLVCQLSPRRPGSAKGPVEMKEYRRMVQ